MRVVNTTQTVNVIREVMNERIRQYQQKNRLQQTDDTEFQGTLRTQRRI